MICDDLSHMRVYRIGSRQSSIMGSPQVIRYSSIPILSYSISFTVRRKVPNFFNFFFNLLKVVTDLYLLGPV